MKGDAIMNSFMTKMSSAFAKQAEAYFAYSFMSLAIGVGAVITASIFISILILVSGTILIRRLMCLQMLS